MAGMEEEREDTVSSGALDDCGGREGGRVKDGGRGSGGGREGGRKRERGEEGEREEQKGEIHQLHQRAFSFTSCKSLRVCVRYCCSRCGYWIRNWQNGAWTTSTSEKREGGGGDGTGEKKKERVVQPWWRQIVARLTGYF